MVKLTGLCGVLKGTLEVKSDECRWIKGLQAGSYEFLLYPVGIICGFIDALFSGQYTLLRDFQIHPCGILFLPMVQFPLSHHWAPVYLSIWNVMHGDKLVLSSDLGSWEIAHLYRKLSYIKRSIIIIAIVQRI